MMEDTDFAGIAAGLDDAIAYARGDTSRGRVATVDVKAVRNRTAMSQDRFAATFGFRAGTVRDWEQGRRQPDTGSATLLRMIAVDPDGVQAIMDKVRA
ncbi:helix-turn-helix domain-containing protein [uncultured Sphingomonas sp.]|uniref:helix-turn-helix domain-containing protein n=1 Tax=uncultured Sphingomonas sp. TaxID=158754 RepID=UPI0035CC3A79